MPSTPLTAVAGDDIMIEHLAKRATKSSSNAFSHMMTLNFHLADYISIVVICRSYNEYAHCGF